MKTLFNKGVFSVASFKSYLTIPILLIVYLISPLLKAQDTSPAPSPVLTSVCDDLSSDAIAKSLCEGFLDEENASGANPSFSHALVVTNADQLRTAVGRSTTEGGESITSRIIVLRNGTYPLPRQVSVSHKVALVGEVNSSQDMPVIKAATGYRTLNSFVSDSLLYLEGGINIPSDIGFYSYNIHWDTTPPDDEADYRHESAISNASYPGILRIYRNRFSQSSSDTPSNEYITLSDSTGDIYIGYSHFDTTHLGVVAIYANCQHCFSANPDLEIAYNDFNDSSVSRKKRDTDEVRADRIRSLDFRDIDIRDRRQSNNIPVAIDVRHYKQFNIHHNRQIADNASALIDIEFSDNTSGINAFIQHNIARSTAPDAERAIYLNTTEGAANPPNLTGSLTISDNLCYTLKNDGGYPARLLRYTESACSTSIPVTTPLPTTSEVPTTTPTPLSTPSATTSPPVDTTESRTITPGSPTVIIPTVSPTLVTGPTGSSSQSGTASTMPSTTSTITTASASSGGLTSAQMGYIAGGVVLGIIAIPVGYAGFVLVTAAIGACGVECAQHVAHTMSCHLIKFAARKEGRLITSDGFSDSSAYELKQ